jgi:hypothetical protein
MKRNLGWLAALLVFLSPLVLAQQTINSLAPVNKIGVKTSNPVCDLDVHGSTCLRGTTTTKAATAKQTNQSPAGTTSATGVMMGLAVQITPASSGRVLFLVSGTGRLTAAGFWTVSLRQGSGTPPINGAALSGTVIGTQSGNVEAASHVAPMAIGGVITGLTVGTPVWEDISLAASSGGGTATAEGVTISAVEL